MLYNNGKCTLIVLTSRQPKSNKETDIVINISFLPTGSTVVVQPEDRGPWMYGTVIGHRSEEQNR